jgi:hypothetical protein
MSSHQIVRPSGENYSIDVVMATEYGIEEAFLIRHLQFWIRFNKNKQTHLIDGRTWTYQTLKEMADHFPFLNERKIKYALDNLEKMGVIFKGNFNKSPIDKTCWYSFVHEDVFVPSLSGNSNKVYERQNCPSTDKIVPSIPDTKTTDTKKPSLKGSHFEDPKPDKKGEGGFPLKEEWQFLKDIDIQDRDKQRLISRYSPSLVKQVIDYVTSPDFVLDKTLEAAIFYYVKNPDHLRENNKEKEIMDDSDQVLLNRNEAEKFACEVRKCPDFPVVFHGGHEGGYVEFRHLNGFKIYFNDKKFDEKFKNAIKSYGEYVNKHKKAQERPKNDL